MLEEKKEKWWRETGRGSIAHGAFRQLTAEEKGGGGRSYTYRYTVTTEIIIIMDISMAHDP